MVSSAAAAVRPDLLERARELVALPVVVAPQFGEMVVN